MNPNSEDMEMTLCFALIDSMHNTFTDSNTVNDSSCVTFLMKGDDGTGITDIHKDLPGLLKPYPNPASGQVSLPLDIREPADILVSIKDIQGKVFRQQHYGRISPDQKRLQLDISHFHPGFYLVTLTADGKQSVGKLVIQ